MEILSFKVISSICLLLVNICSAKEPTYTIIAPDVIRPNSNFFVAVSVHNVFSDQDVLLTIKGLTNTGDNIEISQDTSVRPDETQVVRLGIGNLGEGQYSLHVRGKHPILFERTSKLEYIHQGYSVFVQTDKAIYRPGNIVKFRVIVVSPQLKPSVTGSIDVKTYDGKGHLIRKWDRVFTTAGVFAEEFLIDDDPVRGDWNITVDVSGQLFHKSFQVAEYILPQFIVDIDLPKYGLFNEGKTKATIKATYPHGTPVTGEATVSIFPTFKSGVLQPVFSRPKRQVIPISGQVDVEFDIAKDLNLKHDYFREIVFDVEIKERYTNRVQNNTAVYPMYKYDFKLEMVRTSDAYKPGMPYTAYIKVARQDDTPIYDNVNPVLAKWGFSNDPSKDYNTSSIYADKNGIITLNINTPGVNDTEASVLGIEATYKNLTQWFSTIPKSESRSGLYIRSRLKTKNPSVGDTVNIGVVSSEEIESITYLIFGRGKLVTAVTRKASGTTDNEITFRASSDMSPVCRVIIYYISPLGGEIITDSMDFEVGGILTNFVKIATTKKESAPGKDVTINIKSKPNSFVGVLAVDKSVRSLKSGYDVLLKEVTDELLRYDTATTPSFFSWFKVIEPKEGSLSWYSGSLTAEDTFFKAGTIILTNAVIEKGRLNDNTTYITEEYQRNFAKNRPFGRPLPRPGARTLNPDKGPGLEYESSTRPPLAGPYAFSRIPRPLDNIPKIYLKNDLPDTWLFLNATTDSEGRASIPVKAPANTNTTWVISGFALDDLHGMGITKQLGSIEVFQPFYVEVGLPPSIKLGETLSVQMVVYNYLTEEINAQVSLEGDKNQFVFETPHPNEVEDEEEDLDVGSIKSRQKEVSIRPGRGTVVSFLITPLQLGNIEIKIQATGSSSRGQVGNDIVFETLKVESEGEPMYGNKGFFLDLEDNPIVNETVPVPIPFNYVPGSEEVYISMMADPLSSTMNNIDKLVRYPTGCGEQNMIRIIPSVSVIEYIDAVNPTANHQRNKAIETMALGYQRQLTFKLNDGSFSLFGQTVDEVGSMWITSLVGGNLRKASKYIDVDESVIQDALTWLADNQNEDGGFSEKGKIYFGALQENDIGMTAFVVSALLLNKDELDANSKNSLNRGISFLAKHWKEIESDAEKNPFVLSVVAHALMKAEHPEAGDAVSLLSSFVKRNETMGWEWLEATIPDEIKDNHWFNRTNSLNVQMTSYYALTALNSSLEKAKPILKWLIAQQNSIGGFASTADTFVAIEALKEFALLLKVPEANSRISVQYSYLGTSRQREISSSASTILQRRQLPAETRELEFKAEDGSGVGVVNLEYQYNLNVTASWPSFVLNPQLLPAPSAQIILNSCVHYIYYGSSNSSNMAVMEIDLPSGYTVDVNSLPSLKRYEGVTRVETDNEDTKVILYFNNVHRSEVCPTILAFRTFGVANQRPALIRVYDYYDQSRVSRMFYYVRKATLCDICLGEDCSEGGCPERNSRPVFGSYSYGANVDPIYSGGVGNIIGGGLVFLQVSLVTLILSV